jgi:DNA repair exonuclease SbcCD ATPase subunit
MLYLQKIKYKNILSSGNQFTEIDFDTTKTTLVKGNSGQGKSLIITALIFGLYGKSNRGTVKKQLVNSVNKKDCLVEVEFQNDGKSYIVRRGISPNIFEIYVDGKKQEELSAVKDQQKYLEQNILKMSYKTFMQVVVLGSNNYIPFMQLSTADRRDLVEEILDIKIFSIMNSIIKDKIRSVESKLHELEYKQESAENEIKLQKAFIQRIKNDGLSLIQTKRDKIVVLKEQKEELSEQLQINNSKIQGAEVAISELGYSSKKLRKLLNLDAQVKIKKTNLVEEKKFFEQNSTCPTCKQDLQDGFKDDMILDIGNKLDEIEDNYQQLLAAISEQEDLENKILELNSVISDISSKISNIQTEIKSKESSINELQIEIDEITDKLNNHEEEEKALSGLMKTRKTLKKQYESCKEALHYFQFSHLIMKDGGIKSKIIEKYIPIINAQINKYLQMMDLYLNYTLDDEFKETVNTPIHVGFTYNSFSEGEKQRINLAAILAWREISKLKNSTSCNLIFFDETLDSSLDSSGIDDFLKIINYVIEESNVFVISHREGFDDRFRRVLEVKKVNGFSKVFT